LGPRTPAVDQVHDVGRGQVASEDRAQGFLSVNRPWRPRHATATVIPQGASWRRDSKADE